MTLQTPPPPPFKQITNIEKKKKKHYEATMKYLLIGRARSSIFIHSRDENENRQNLEGVVCNLAKRESQKFYCSKNL